MPPNITTVELRLIPTVLQHVADVVVNIKRKFNVPYILIAGVFNQWRAADALDEFADVTEVQVGATRGSRKIDRIFSNMGRSVVESGIGLHLRLRRRTLTCKSSGQINTLLFVRLSWKRGRPSNGNIHL